MEFKRHWENLGREITSYIVVYSRKVRCSVITKFYTLVVIICTTTSITKICAFRSHGILPYDSIILAISRFTDWFL